MLWFYTVNILLRKLKDGNVGADTVGNRYGRDADIPVAVSEANAGRKSSGRKPGLAGRGSCYRWRRSVCDIANCFVGLV